MRSFLDAWRHIWEEEESLRLRKIADRYDLRRHMDGEVIQKTGEIIPKESA